METSAIRNIKAKSSLSKNVNLVCLQHKQNHIEATPLYLFCSVTMTAKTQRYGLVGLAVIKIHNKIKN